MDEVEKAAFDQFLKIIGNKKYPLFAEENRSVKIYPAIVNSRFSIGPCFYMIGNTHTLNFLEISDGSKEVTGYTSEEIIKTGWDFYFKVMHPEDREPCLEMIQIAWNFLNNLPDKKKLDYVCLFYYRIYKKDGKLIKIQHQAINLELDKDNIISLACVIFTDVSHLELPDQVKLTIVDTKNNSCFSATTQQPQLKKEPIHLSKREVEILKLIIKGLTSHEIADKLFISYFTVRAHRKNILEKLGKKNTAEMISYAFQNGLL